MPTNEIGALSLQVRELLDRVKRIEGKLGLHEERPDIAAKAAVNPTSISKPKPVESGSGNLFGVVASICFVLAGIFIVKLAIDQGWLTPVRQIGLAALFALTLIAAGLFLRKKDSAYAGFLPASGIILLYMTVYGAHLYYGLLGVTEAGIGACATTIVGLWLFTKFRHDFYVVVAAVGSYLLPVVVAEFRRDLIVLSIFFLSFTAFASIISAFIQSRLLPLLSAYLGIGIMAACALAQSDPAAWRLGVVVQVLQFFLLGLGVVFYSVRNRALSENEAWLYFPILLFFYSTEYLLLTKIDPNLAPWISLGFAAFLYGLYHVSKKRLKTESLASGGLVIAFCSVVLFHSVYLELLPTEIKSVLFFVLLFAAPAFLSGSEKSIGSAPIRHPVVALVLFLVLGLEYGKIIIGLIHDTESLFILKGLLCAVGVVYLWLLRGTRLHDFGHALLATAHIQAVLALYRLSSPIGSFAVSLSWAIYALAILALSFYRHDKTLGRSSAVVLSIAALKVLLYDASSAAPIIRIGCLLMTGVLLYFSGFLFRKIAKWK